MGAGAHPQVAVAVLGQTGEVVRQQPVAAGVGAELLSVVHAETAVGRHPDPAVAGLHHPARPPHAGKPRGGIKAAQLSGRRGVSLEHEQRFGRGDPQAVLGVEKQRHDGSTLGRREERMLAPTAIGETVQETGRSPHPEPARAVGSQRRGPHHRLPRLPRLTLAPHLFEPHAVAGRMETEEAAARRGVCQPDGAAIGINEQRRDPARAPGGSGRVRRRLEDPARRSGMEIQARQPAGRGHQQAATRNLQQRGYVRARQALAWVLADEPGAVEAAEPGVRADPQEASGVLQDRVDSSPARPSSTV